VSSARVGRFLVPVLARVGLLVGGAEGMASGALWLFIPPPVLYVKSRGYPLCLQ